MTDGMRWVTYKSLPKIIKAVQMSEDFEVDTLEGLMHGNAGDYLVTGIQGERYPCKKEIFEASYEVIRGVPEEIL